MQYLALRRPVDCKCLCAGCGNIDLDYLLRLISLFLHKYTFLW